MKRAVLVWFLALASCGGTSSQDVFDRNTGGAPAGEHVAQTTPGRSNPTLNGSTPSPSQTTPSSSAGAITRVQITQKGGAGGVEIALPATTREGSLLVLAVGVIWPGDPGPVVVTDPWRPVVASNDDFIGSISSTLFMIEGANARAANEPFRVSVGAPLAHVFATIAEYAGVRASGSLDRTASGIEGGTGRTAQTAQPDELWLAAFTSRDFGHGPPTDGFVPVSTNQSGLGSMTFAERIASHVGSAGTTFPEAGFLDSAGVTATFKR